MAQNQVLGSGKLYFDQFKLGTLVGSGEMYLGNTPELSVTRAETKLDHWNTDEGKKFKDKSVSLSEDMTAKFQTDDISPANLALWFAGESRSLTITAGTAITETIEAVKQGRFYQIGKSAASPSGARKISNVIVKIATATIAAPGNYTVDLALGRLQVLAGAADIPDDSDLAVTYDEAAGVREVVVTQGQQIEGALRFISKNQEGKQADYFYPYVKLTASGDFALKGDTWQILAFDVEVLQLNDTTERAYIDTRA